MVYKLKIIKQELQFEECLKQRLEFYFNFAEDNSAIVRVFPLEDYYKLDPNNKMEKYRFKILYINEEDKFEMQDFDTAFDYISDESNVLLPLKNTFRRHSPPNNYKEE